MSESTYFWEGQSSVNTQLQPPIQPGWAWQYSWLDLSLADIIVVLLMVFVFIIALVLPFPGGHDR